ncbi:MAG: class I SAM-dependent methyltransferase [Acidimicrobiales bacterium]
MPNDSDEVEERAYLDQVRREIDEEVRRRRASGEFPPSFERRLDEIFARFTPTGEGDDHFTEALKLADRAAYFDIDVPRGSRREPRGFVKWSLWQAEAWFVRYVVNQLNHFAASSQRVLHLLDERLRDAEDELDVMRPDDALDGALLVPGADPGPYVGSIVDKLRSVDGRVLHAECGDGAVLAALASARIDAYGIDPGTDAADSATLAGLDVRRDVALGHLDALAIGTLGAVILSGIVDRASLPERRRLLAAAERAVRPGGALCIIGTEPALWSGRVGPVVADLSPGSPLHAETWVHLLSQAGLPGAEVQRTADSYCVTVLVAPREQ